MARYVLFRKYAAAEVNIEEAVQAEGGEVLDDTAGRAYLIEVEPPAAEALRGRLKGWAVELETEIEPPAAD